MIILIALSVAIVIANIVDICIAKEITFGQVSSILMEIIIFMIALLIYCEPTAMDVYQGNTTLEITYKDGIPVDSVVVFKDKKL